jgi:hypothetical protein
MLMCAKICMLKKYCMLIFEKKQKIFEMNCQMIRNVITQVLFGVIKNTGGG